VASPDLPQLRKLLPSSKHGTLYAIDLETIGTDATMRDSVVVGIGFANADSCFYFDIRDMEPEAFDYLIDFLGRIQITTFNVLFDGTFLAALTGRWLNFVGCSYALFKQLSSEGFDGQSWKLEVAQYDVLGWPISNKEVLDEALKERGLTKGEMWKLPVEILGVYCASDADAAWQLWEHLTALCNERGFDLLMEYHQREFMTEVRLLAEQQFRGIAVDLDGLKTYHTELLLRIDSAMKAFLNHPQIAPHIELYNKDVVFAMKATAPAQHTVKGTVSKHWLKWKARIEERIAENVFNPNSTHQLCWLFYEKVFNVVRETHKEVIIEVDGKQFEVEKTEKGARSVKKQLLPLFGEPGALLMKYNKLRKEAGYVLAAINKAEEGQGIIRPQYNSVGTITGRLSGGNSDV
jgi:DNA polymerase I-like protein with 3'-5' exonuclease and polymerase domains